MEDSKRQNKGQKLASAIYFITTFFDDKEPLKWAFRTLAIDLAGEKIKDKSSISKEILSLFTMAKDTGLVSGANYNILASELSKFEKELETPLYKTFFRDMNIEEKTLPEPDRAETIKDKNLLVEPKALRREPLLETANKPLREYGVVSVKKNSRQSTIIGLLKRKKEIMIKDVSPLISGCSEKTIQRELLAMVAAGILRKIGEKRWSRYTFA